MTPAALCFIFGLLCVTDRETPPQTLSPNLTPPIMAGKIYKPSKVEVNLSTPNAFPSTCRCQPPKKLRQHFVDAAMRHPGGPSACWLACQALCESDYRIDAQSPAGAKGLMQFVDRTAAELKIDAWDPREAIFGAAKYDKWTRDRWTAPPWGDRTAYDIRGLGAGSYNNGHGNMRGNQERNGWVLYGKAEPFLPKETQGYFKCIENGGR